MCIKKTTVAYFERTTILTVSKSYNHVTRLQCGPTCQPHETMLHAMRITCGATLSSGHKDVLAFWYICKNSCRVLK
jgi:hypothetical protein